MRGWLKSGLVFPITPPKQAMPLFEAVFVPQVNGEIEVSLAMVYPGAHALVFRLFE